MPYNWIPKVGESYAMRNGAILAVMGLANGMLHLQDEETEQGLIVPIRWLKAENIAYRVSPVQPPAEPMLEFLWR